MEERYPPKRSGRPRVEVDYALVLRLQDVENLGWSRGAEEYRRRTSQWISRDTFKRRYLEAIATESLEARIKRVFEECLRKLKTQGTTVGYLQLFLQSRQAMEVSPGTLSFYRAKLGRFLSELDADTVQRQDIEAFLLQFKNPGNRHAYYRALKTFYNWRSETFGLPSPMKHMRAPRLGKLILPSLTRDEVLKLLEATNCVRDKAIISLFTESGLRLSELASIKPDNINWTNRTIQIIGKGRKEAVAPFGPLTESYLRAWLGEYKADGNIWGLNTWGISSMLRRLRQVTGLLCNPHTFRRTFACLLRKAGVDTMTIKELGRWESLEMVQRYTRSVTFNDSLKFYKAPLKEGE